MHCLDFQIAHHSSTAQQQSVAIQNYANHLQHLSTLREDRAKVEQRAQVTEQVLTLSAVNQSDFTITPELVANMVQEAAKLRKELEDLVSMTKPCRNNVDTTPIAGQIHI